MKKTPILSLKAWSKIHPPLPRTPRESQQLLSALTSSFRRQLDTEFPTSEAPDRARDGGQRTSKPDSAVHMADRHFQDILENPLFRVVPSKEQHGWQRVNSGRLAKEPMMIFDELAASGSVTHERLFQCLQCQFLLSSTAKGDLVGAMRASKAGSKVISWWFASEPKVRKRLFNSNKAPKYLVKFLAAEGLQDTVMVWLRMLLRPNNEGHISAHPLFSYLLSDFLIAEIEYGHGLGSALGYYIQACQLISSLNGQPIKQYDEGQKKTLTYGALKLNKWIIQHGQAQLKDTPASTYEKYMRLISALAPLRMLSDALPLYHPTSPDTKPFLKIVHDVSWIDGQTDEFRELYVRASFDALRLLLDREQYGDATHLAHRIQQLLPGKNASETTSSVSYHVSPEEEYLLGRLEHALT